MRERFGQRLRVARKMAGLSQEALAKATGDRVTKQAISKYEKGMMNPDSANLVAMSKALSVDTGFFYRKTNVKLNNIEFRKRARLGQKEKERIKYQAIDFLERYIEMEDILGQQIVFKNPIKKLKIASQDDIERAAEMLRIEWKVGKGPILKLIELLEEKGVRIYEIEADEAFDGLSAWAGAIPLIIINSKFTDLVRKRLTIVHELAHLMLKIADTEQKVKEKWCYKFAGAFLLPEEIIYSELGKSRRKITEWELKKIKGVYGISMWAIMARANNLEIITDNAYRGFCIYANKNYRPEEPGAYRGKEKANRFDQLVYHAVAEDIITMSKGAELLNIKLSSFRSSFKIVL